MSNLRGADASTGPLPEIPHSGGSADFARPPLAASPPAAGQAIPQPGGAGDDRGCPAPLPVHNSPPIPELLPFGGEEDLGHYRDAFEELVKDLRPILTPRGHIVILKPDAFEHTCIAKPRGTGNQRRGADGLVIREAWRIERAQHISWIWLALTNPTAIVRDNIYSGNEIHLLGFPSNNPVRPSSRYLVSVTPRGKNRREYNTAYPITQREWDNAFRGRAGETHVLYRRAGTSRY